MRLLTFAAVAILMLLIFFSRLTVINDPDVFMHLRTGQWIIDNHQIPRTDPFSYTAQGKPWDDHEWLFQVFSYAAYKAGGLKAVGIIRAVIETLALFLLFLLCRKRGAGILLAATLTMFAAVGTWMFNEPRPYIVTPLGIVLFLLAIENILAGKRQWMFVPPIVMLLWVNMHAGFTAGCMLLVIYFLGTLIDSLRRSDLTAKPLARLQPSQYPLRHWLLSSPAGRILLTGAVTLIAVLCNPYGWRILLFPFKLVSHDVLMTMIQEWNPAAIESESVYFYIAALLLLARALVVFRRARLADLACAVIFTLMALTARRHISLFFFITMPIAAAWFSTIALPRFSARMRARRWRFIPVFAAWIILIALSAIWTHSTQWAFGLGMNKDFFSPRACDLVLEYKLKPRLFNSFNFGGYIIDRLYPQYQVFIDGRADVYGDEINRTFAGIFNAKPGWREELDKIGANIVLMDQPIAEKRNIIDALSETPEWVLIYWDDSAYLYVRDIPEHRDVIEKHGYRAIHPLKTDGNLDAWWKDPSQKAQGLLELERRAQEPVPCRMVYRNLSYIYGRMGEKEKAMAAVNQYLALEPENADMLMRKGQVSEQMGITDDAKKYYEEATKANPNFAAPYIYLGGLYQAEGNWETAEMHYRRAYEIKPLNLKAALHLAVAVIQRTDWQEGARLMREYIRTKHLRGVKIEPNDWEVLAFCYDKMNDPFRAAKARKQMESAQGQGI